MGFHAPFVYSGKQDGKYMLENYTDQVYMGTYAPFNSKFIIDEVQHQYGNTSGLYVLGIKYRRVWNQQKNRKVGGDSQLTVTGTVTDVESFDEGMLRELREEIGGNIEDVSILPKFRRTTNGRTFVSYVVNVSSLSKIPESEKSKQVVGKDDRNKKVEISIVGTLAEFQMFFGRVDCRLNDTDGIEGCVLFAFGDFVKQSAMY
jgi:hypothetical protein